MIEDELKASTSLGQCNINISLSCETLPGPT